MKKKLLFISAITFFLLSNQARAIYIAKGDAEILVQREHYIKVRCMPECDKVCFKNTGQW